MEDLQLSVLKHFKFGEINVSIACEEVLLPFEAIGLMEGVSGDLTGKLLWDAALVMCCFVERAREIFHMLNVLELGKKPNFKLSFPYV